MTLTIAHTVAGLEPEQGGLAYAVPEMARAASQRGHRNHLFSLGTPLANPTDHDQRYPNALHNLPVLKRLGVSPAMRKALLTSGADLFHAHGLWMMPGIYAARASYKQQKPLVLSPHGMLTPEALKFSPRKKKLFATAFQNAAFQTVNCIHATATLEMEELRGLGFTHPIAIIPNGMEAPETLPPLPTGKRCRSVLSLGRIHQKKGLDRLIQAWADLEPDFPDWRLDIIGPDENGHTNELKTLTAKLGLAHVHFSGPVYGDAKWSLYRKADLFALATLTENFALTIPEALACETPAICTHGAPWKGLQTENCGWWIEHGPQAMSTALRKAMSLPDAKRHNMGAKGRAWVIRDFGWKKISESLSALYLWLCGYGKKPDFVYT